MNTGQVIVYRSKWEAERDQFFLDNPEYILYFTVGAIILAGLIIAVDKLRKMFGVRR